MNASRPSETMRRNRSSVLPKKKRVAQPRRQQPHYLPQVLEANAILGVNLLLGAMAISTLLHLVPYQLNQQAKLRAMQAEVDSTAQRVSQLKNQSQRSQDPTEAKRIVQEQSNLIDAQQRKVVWIRP